MTERARPRRRSVRVSRTWSFTLAVLLGMGACGAGGAAADPDGSVATNARASVLPRGAERYAGGLMRAWSAGSRRAAARYARPSVVRAMFDHADPGWSTWRRTAVEGAAGSVHVVYAAGDAGSLTLTLSNRAAARGLEQAVGDVEFDKSASDQAPSGAVSRPCPDRMLAGMSLAQRVGQLFVAGVRGTRPTRRELVLIHRHHLGGVVLMGHDSIGVDATRRIAGRLQDRASSDGVKLWVAADQEGGQVQRLQGPGFSVIPEALAQGRLRPRVLRRHARRWADQLRQAGVNLNLAPVLDTVPASLGESNTPIGGYHREFGHTPRRVRRHGTAVLAGMRAQGVTPVVKHFPGLGRVRRNTDTSRNVVDYMTTRTDPYLAPFAAAVKDGVRVVMVSSARYTRIDRRHLAPFSRTILHSLLREDLGFGGVIMSDDLARAKALSRVPVGRRAVRFLRAGGSVVLAVDADAIPSMVHAVLTLARERRYLRHRVTVEARRVLRAKFAAGLLPCS